MNKLTKFLIIFLILPFTAIAQISSLPKCQGEDYKKWTDCYAEIKFPRIEYKGEWKDGMFHGQGIAKDTNGTMIGQFEKNLIVSGKANFIDGGSYEGQWKNDQFHGQGKSIFPNGGSYEGGFNNGAFEGKGKLIYANGTVSEGNFKNRALNGKGKIIYANGNKSEGNYVDGSLNGKGKYIYASGDISEGNFKEGKLHGKAKHFFNQNEPSVYDGEWVNGDMTGYGIYKDKYGTYTGSYVSSYHQGNGKYIWKDGSSYEGEFHNHLRNGFGKFTYKDGSIYEGYFKDGLEQGKGTMVYSKDVDGWHKYEGDWDDGLETGYGNLELKNGDMYSGYFKQSVFNGKGKYTWVTGDIYDGEWVSGSKEGKGFYSSSTGFSYEGEYKNDEPHGKGKYVYSDGAIYIGNFLNGSEHGFGEITYKNDLDGRKSYSGSWEHGFPNGKGKMVYANGSSFDGMFKDGKKIEGNTSFAKFTTEENYYALIIGNNKYLNKENLSAAVNDAEEISRILKEKYNFEVTTLVDAKYSDIVDNLIKFTKNRKPLDNLLIYYAGHGELSDDENKGYWLPIDAGDEQDSKWVSNDIVRSRIKATKAKHVLLVVDSCFAGSISRGSNNVNRDIEKLNNINVINRLKMRKTRLVITSGGNEPVSDTDGGKHSVFANKFIDVLKNNNKVIQSMHLFQNVSDYVINNAQQTPNRTVIFKTGDDGGDFLFFPNG